MPKINHTVDNASVKVINGWIISLSEATVGTRPDSACSLAKYARGIRKLGFQDSGMPVLLTSCLLQQPWQLWLKAWEMWNFSVWLPLEKWINIPARVQDGILAITEKIKQHALIGVRGLDSITFLGRGRQTLFFLCYLFKISSVWS